MRELKELKSSIVSLCTFATKAFSYCSTNCFKVVFLLMYLSKKVFMLLLAALLTFFPKTYLSQRQAPNDAAHHTT